MSSNANKEIDKFSQKTNQIIDTNRAAEKQQSATKLGDVPKEAKQI